MTDPINPHCDPKTWESLVTAHGRPLAIYAQRMLHGDQQAAEDAVQESFLKLARLEAHEWPERPSAWLFTVCRRLTLDHQRKERRMTPMSDMAQEPQKASHRTPESSLEHQETSAQIMGHLSGLEPRAREVVRLKFQGGLRYREIAEVMGISVTNVGVILHEALNTLRTRCAPLRTEESAS